MFIKVNGELAPKEFMNEMEKSIYFINDSEVLFSNEDNQFIGDFSKINLFVGSNNSGKSRFLRGLLKLNKDEYQISNSLFDIDYWVDKAQKSYDENIRQLQNYNYRFAKQISDIYEKLQLRDNFYKVLRSNQKDNTKILEEAELFRKADLDYVENHKGNLRSIEARKSRLLFLNSLKELREQFIFINNKFVSEKVYIPILRSIKKSSNIDEDVFEKVTRELYSLEKEKIFTGLDLYNKVLEVRNSVLSERRGFEKFESFLRDYFFDGQKVEIIASLKEKCIILYVGGEERKIHEIGDGIQTIILLLFPIFTAKKNSWILIEEPETYLHPGLQRIFIQTLIENQFLRKLNLMFFFSTHSNHFLDLSLDHKEISIFQFKKFETDKFQIRTNITPNQDTLNLLGVNTSSVFLTNTSLWVEGPTDRKYLSFFLKKYCESKKLQSLKEDIDFAFFEYGGNLIAHYLFDKDDFEADEEVVREKINSFSLSNRIYLLADEDGAKGNTKKGRRRKALQELSNKSKNFKYQNTELREIENLLPLTVIDNFMGELIKSTQAVNIEKTDFKKKDYDSIGIGQFFEDQLKNRGILVKNQKSFNADSGTLKNDFKIKLCDYTINSGLTYEEIIDDNPILDRIITELYSFIKN